MTDMPKRQVTFHATTAYAWPWHREEVHLDGKQIGYLIYRHIQPIPGVSSGPGWTQFLIADRAQRRVDDPRCSFLDRDTAVAILVAHTTSVAAA